MTLRVTVLGATGGQGGGVARALLEAGHTVRAVVRDPAGDRAQALRGTGAEVVSGDLADTGSLSRAFAGADAAFAVTTPFERGPEAEVAQGKAIVRAAVTSALPHLVLSSVASAPRSTGVPHFESKRRIEDVLAAEGPPATVVAPTYFYDNLLGDLSSVRAGVLRLPLPVDRQLQQVSRENLGALVAAVVADRERHLGRRVEVASDDPTPARMAAALSQALGMPVTAEALPPAQVREQSADMGAMWDFLGGEGYGVDLPALHGAYPEIAWTGFADWARGLRRPVGS
ncbi:NmrA family NAD(P)-binding protein [Streptomyces sp. NPDC086010]|uniref:NmrA family NAD(P)-binding protein n=1 Tax=Streptomyces sp. NPDC086010 TaxID=3365745 RepID=UPI0037D1E68A